MFTVKVIDEEGNENILDAISFHVKAGERRTSDAPPPIENVAFQTSEGADIEISGQGITVYVMNDSGKTVGKYLLGKQMAVVSIE